MDDFLLAASRPSLTYEFEAMRLAKGPLIYYQHILKMKKTLYVDSLLFKNI